MEIPLLQDIVVILGLSVLVILFFQKLKIPAILGYFFTGAIAGPYGLSLIKASEEVNILAEIGIILLLFIIGLEFSLKKLSSIKKTVLIGGTTQVFLTIIIFSSIALFFDFPYEKAVFMGFLFSMSSTAIVLKILQTKGEVVSPHGKIALGILIFQDIIVVPMMLITPILSGESDDISKSVILLLVKGLITVVVMLITAKYIVPNLLYQVAKTKSSELFILSVVVICFAIAWLTSMLGLSLALGAFMAGLIISESEYRAQATGNILPFREVFISFFFVSVGMLLDLSFLMGNILPVLFFTLLTILLKGLIAGLAARLMNFPLRTVLLVGMSLFQVGEFSFILSQEGLKHGILDEMHYQYFLSVSIISMALTPLFINFSHQISLFILNLLSPQKTHEDSGSSTSSLTEGYKDHIVIIGYGLNGKNVARAAKESGIPYVIAELNTDTVRTEKSRGEHIIFGDAIHPHILLKLYIHTARVVVIAISDPEATRIIIGNIRQINKRVHIIVRTRFIQEIEENLKAGADEVIPEEFETSIEIFTRVLTKYLIPQDKIEEFTNSIRTDNYGMLRPSPNIKSRLKFPEIDPANVEFSSLTIQCEDNDVVGKKIKDSSIRRVYGITVVAIKRDDKVIYDITGDTRILQEDILYVFGEPEKIRKFADKISL
jgi:monovalent cation:H+ antiporter-2, CPA2 family